MSPPNPKPDDFTGLVCMKCCYETSEHHGNYCGQRSENARDQGDNPASFFHRTLP